MGGNGVDFELVDQTGVITLARPERLNAIGLDMVEGLMGALKEGEERARALVLKAEGRAFCTGYDMSGPTSADGTQSTSPLESHFNPLLKAIRGLKVPLVNAVQGACAGAGASLALAGDLIVASEDAFFLQAFSRVGLVPDMGSPYLLVRTIGRVRANEMMLLGERLSASDALTMGLVNRVVPGEELAAIALDIAAKLAGGPTVSLGQIRRLAWQAGDGTLDDELEREALVQSRVAQSDDYREGVAAFREKRRPRFTGN